MIAPKFTEERLDKTSKAWEALAPDKKFGGMTLAEFKAQIKPSLDARDEVKTVTSKRMDARTRRELSDADSLRLLNLVVNSIKGDPTEGEDSALYQACGYVRKSERKTGLTRKAVKLVVPATPLPTTHPTA